MLRVWTVPDEGLGNSSYLAEVGDDVALVIDPGRDPRPYLELAARYRLGARFAAGTHVHADFVSGGRELAGLGARLLAPAGAGLRFGHEQGERGATGASLLAAAGARGVSVLCGGPADWARATGESPEHR